MGKVKLVWGLYGVVVGILFGGFLLAAIEPQTTTAPGKAVSQGATKDMPVTVTDVAVTGTFKASSAKSEKEVIADACDKYYKSAVDIEQSRSVSANATVTAIYPPATTITEHAALMQAYTQLYMACREREK